MNSCIICLDNHDLFKNHFCSCNFHFHSTCYFNWLKKNPRAFKCVLCKHRINKPHVMKINSFVALNNYLEIRNNFFKNK